MSPLINSTPTATMFGTVSTLQSLVVPFQFSWGGASLVGINDAPIVVYCGSHRCGGLS